MKNTFFTLTKIGLFSLSNLFAAYAVAQSSPYLPPDNHSEAQSNAMVLIKNDGQVINQQGNLSPTVKYYMPNSLPSVFAEASGCTFAVLKTQNPEDVPVDSIPIDTTYSIGMAFHTEGVPVSVSPAPVGEVNQKFNYFMSYVVSGTCTDVKAYTSIVYETVWPFIDVVVTTNVIAPKVYFVVHPGGDPDNIELQFDGQDQITLATNGALDFLIGAAIIELPELEAYSVDPTTNALVATLPSQPTWNNNGGGYVTVGTGTYDPTKILVLASGVRPGILASALPAAHINWSTYIGTQGNDAFFDAAHDPNNNNAVVAVGATTNAEFPNVNGSFTHKGNIDGIICKFKESGELLWTSYYGTELRDQGGISHVAIKSTGEIYFMAGVSDPGTPRLQSKTGAFYVDNTTHPNDTRVLGALDKNGNILNYATHFGNYSKVNRMVFDNSDNLYLVGAFDDISYSGIPNTSVSFPITVQVLIIKHSLEALPVSEMVLLHDSIIPMCLPGSLYMEVAVLMK